MENQDARTRAREIARTRYRLRWHILAYILVNVGLLFTWWITGMGFFWPAFPIFFWGIGVVVHYLNAYRTPEHAWIDRETERILRERDQGSDDR